MSDFKKFEKIIPVGDKNFAYQCENVDPILVLKGSLPFRSGREPYENEEKYRVSSYELRIHKHTSNSIIVELRKYRNDTVEQRKAKGRAITYECYSFTTDFAFLVNQIFKGVEIGEYHREEAFPREVEELMKTVYR